MAQQINLTTAADVLAKATLEAMQVTKDYLAQHGNYDACGFAWVKVRGVRTNSKLGKLLIENGFSKAYGGGLQLWNPSKNFTQAITAKERGAEAYATILRNELGLDAFADSRMD